ncbi:unnamed protein product, partial [marine sediment metagenome]
TNKMPSWGDAFDAIGTGTGSSIWMIVAIGVGIFVGLLLLGIAGWWWFFKKRWNIKAEIKLTRSGGRLTNAEWGKAMFNAKRGVCFVKRPGIMQRAVPVRIFDIRKYIQGNDIVTFIQVTPEDLRPVLNDSWEEYEDDEPMKDAKGNIITDEEGNPVHEKASMMNIRVDTGLNKAWRAAWTQAAKSAYSLKSFFAQFQTPIAIAIVIIAVFVGFAMVWTRLGSVCG